MAEHGTGGRGRPPVRLVHLGLGGFFRAHQAWYTGRAPDGGDWGYAAFTGRDPGLARALRAQDGRYTLITRGPEQDEFDLVSVLSAVHAADEHAAWLGYFARPELAVVTVTVTEAGYLSGPDGGLDARHPQVRADIEALRADPRAAVRTAPARLAAGLAARQRAGAGPVAVIPCDNLPGNGTLAARVVADLARLAGLGRVLAGPAAVVSTVADRITPRAGPAERRAVAAATGRADRCPVVTEPFAEWVLAGEFPAGRPQWEQAGARLTADIAPFEQRKLWLLNGTHSLLAYTGPLRGHRTVAAAFADQQVRAWLEQWWSEAAGQLGQPAAGVVAYRGALAARFGNTRMADQLARIAADGSQKLPARVLPVLRARRAAGVLPPGAITILAGWLCHLRGAGAPVSDARAAEVAPLARGPARTAAARVLGWLDPALGEDGELAAAVAARAAELAGYRPGGRG